MAKQDVIEIDKGINQTLVMIFVKIIIKIKDKITKE